jgi:hypothetical protein
MYKKAHAAIRQNPEHEKKAEKPEGTKKKRFVMIFTRVIVDISDETVESS